MEQINQELVIILPERMENMKVRIISDEKEQGLSIKVVNQTADSDTCCESRNLHTAIYRQDRYEHIPMNEILWIEANGSYCHVHTAQSKVITLSYPLKCVQEALPTNAFVRIHRSYLVNIDHVRYIVGNGIVIGNEFLKIGKEYRKEVIGRFIFLGVRNKPSSLFRD